MGIQILPDSVAKLISAGEVVERPASVVKELIENSIDANAQKIVVSIDGDKISVFDDGDGMSEEDLLLCFKKNATSKIFSERDLFSIKTFGFRGEALYAISSVSKTTIRSRREEDEIGTEIVVVAGKLKEVGKVYILKGTEVIVEDLFFNTPARKKFLSAEHIEFQQCQEVVKRFALSTNIEITLKKDGEIVSFFPKERKLEDILPRERIKIEFSTGNIKIFGYLLQNFKKYIFVNGRYIKDKLISGILSSYFNFDYVIFIECPYDFYDVNVHPAKIEVRWRAPKKIREILILAIENALGYRKEKREEGRVEESREEKKGEIEKKEKEEEKREEVEKKIIRTFPKILFVWKIYAFLEHEGKIYIVDIHAYHENKRYREILEGKGNERLKLLLPIEIEEYDITILDELDVKYEIKDEKIIIKELPYYLSPTELITYLKSGYARGEILADIACKSSLKMGDKISEMDLVELLKDFETNIRCPHGRPAVIELTEEELEKKFGRC